MKPYFLHWVVNDDPKVDVNPNTWFRHPEGGEPYQVEGKEGLIWAIEACEPIVELKLCSHQVKVGDTDVCLRHASGEEEWIAQVRHQQQLDFLVGLTSVGAVLFRVVSSISPEAMCFAKAGMEFTEEEVNILVADPDDSTWFASYEMKEDWTEELEMGFYLIAEIKGPCGHFH